MRQLLRRAWYLLRRSRMDDDLAEEMELHREMAARDRQAAGADPIEAAFAARRAFGSAALARDRSRDVWLPHWLQGAGQDVRIAIRSLGATPSSRSSPPSRWRSHRREHAIFPLVNSLAPGRRWWTNDRLVPISDTGTRGTQYRWRRLGQLRQRPELFQAAGLWNFTRFNLAAAGETRLADGGYASGSFFDTLGIRAVLGRTLSIADDRPGGGAGGPVAVISYAFWQREFGGAPDVIGRRLTLEGVPVSIVGVTPRGYVGIDVGRAFDLIVPLHDEPIITGRDSALTGRVLGGRIIARLKPAQSPAAATAALRAAQPAIREATRPSAAGADPYGRDYMKEPFTLVPAATGYSDFRGRYVRPLVMTLMAAGLVLLIACANVANLLLARAAARGHELSVRVALGASRWRLMRSLLAESAVLALTAGGLGILIASSGSRLLVRQLSTPTGPVFLDLSPDWRLLTFALAVATITMLLFGIAPAIRASAGGAARRPECTRPRHRRRAAIRARRRSGRRADRAVGRPGGGRRPFRSDLRRAGAARSGLRAPRRAGRGRRRQARRAGAAPGVAAPRA
jgi:hypothetical protein